MAEITLHNLGKTYPNGTVALYPTDLTIHDGEFVVLVGPSGCGKSTILRMIAGLEPISQGEILIDGMPQGGTDPGQRDIAMVFQNYALYPQMSVRGNLSYGLRKRRTPRAEIERRVCEAAKMLQINELLNRKPRQLSGGQRQRVAMGRALVRSPRAFLFDEPLSNLDAKLRIELRNQIKALHKRIGATFVFVTHDQAEAMSMADRIVVMNRGRIEQVGTPRDIYDRPASLFVAKFVGTPSMNLLEGEIIGESGTVGIRPEDVTPSGDGKQLSGRIARIEDLGADLFVTVDLDGATPPAQIVLRATAQDGLREGGTLAVTLPEAKLHRFARTE